MNLMIDVLFVYLRMMNMLIYWMYKQEKKFVNLRGLGIFFMRK